MFSQAGNTRGTGLSRVIMLLLSAAVLMLDYRWAELAYHRVARQLCRHCALLSASRRRCRTARWRFASVLQEPLAGACALVWQNRSLALRVGIGCQLVWDSPANRPADRLAFVLTELELHGTSRVDFVLANSGWRHKDSDMPKTALLTGLTGQDGSYLAELLLVKGYRVCGHVRPLTTDGATRTDSRQLLRTDLGASNHLRDRLEVCCFQEDEPAEWNALLERLQPSEIYHLAASSSVQDSWHAPVQVNHANIDLTANLLEAVRRYSPASKMFFACSSEIFGLPSESPQHEGTPLQPCTPYGISKAAGYWLVHSYRQRYGLFLCSGILFNHESPRRSEHFVSRKITRGAVKIKLGLVESLELGDLSACRDWGYAGDFVQAMWSMLQLSEAQDFVIGSGDSQPTLRLVELAFSHLGLDWHEFVKTNPAFVRPHDPRNIVADIDKARSQLGWMPQTTLNELIEIMVRADMDALTHFRHNTAAA